MCNYSFLNLEVRMENMIIMALNGFQKIRFLRLPLEICLLPKSWLVESNKIYLLCLFLFIFVLFGVVFTQR